MFLIDMALSSLGEHRARGVSLSICLRLICIDIVEGRTALRR